MKKLKIWLKIDIVGELALRHVNLLFQKTTADDDDDDDHRSRARLLRVKFGRESRSARNVTVHRTQRHT